MKYIFVGEDGEVIFYTDSEPTALDIQTVRQGYLQIIRVDDMTMMGKDDAWVPIEKGQKMKMGQNEGHWTDDSE